MDKWTNRKTIRCPRPLPHSKSKKLPAIFPVLLYSGEETWTAPTDLVQLLEQPHLFSSYTPQFRYFKIAENEYSQAQLLQMSNLVSTLFLAETQPDVELLKQELLKLFEREDDKEEISLLLNWFKQLVVHERREASDYETLEPVYQTKMEAQQMLETALAKERQRWFEQGKAAGQMEAQQMLETALAKEQQRLFEQGKAEGEAEGKAEGKAEGEATGKAQF